MAILLQLKDITKRFATRTLIEGATLSVSEGQKIGFIGRNGSGKSTLLSILIGEEKADGGEVIRHPGLRLGYLEQHDRFQTGETVMDFLMRMSGKPEWECAKMAGRFQLKKDALTTVVTELSGGGQMRVKLTALLLGDPNLLVMDEPTNYLDLQTQIALEAFLRDFRGAFIVVSHDREFLKDTCDETLEIERGALELYHGGIEAYLAHKEEQLELKKRHNKKIEAKQRHIGKFVERFRANASKVTQVQSRLKMLAKLKKIDIEHALKTVRIYIPPVEGKKGVALRLQDLAIGYGDKRVADGITLDIERSDKVAILGENGQGKTTLLKTIAGELEPLEGTYRWGHKLKVAYYAQHVHRALIPHEKVGGYLERLATRDLVPEVILQMAGNFLFTGDDLDKTVDMLSGGEKARLILAGMLLTRPDVLVLDEPTNHLDLETVEALGEALKEYAGTILFVSHSRTFVNQIANKVLEVGGGKVGYYPGTYEEYVLHVRETYGGPQAPREDKVRTGKDDAVPKKRTRQEAYQEMREKRRQLAKLEKQMDEFAAEKQALQASYAADPAFSMDRDKRLHTLETVLRHTEDEWIRVTAEIDKLDREQWQ